jgi:fumarate reductase subunit C
MDNYPGFYQGLHGNLVYIFNLISIEDLNRSLKSFLTFQPLPTRVVLLIICLISASIEGGRSLFR